MPPEVQHLLGGEGGGGGGRGGGGRGGRHASRGGALGSSEEEEEEEAVSEGSELSDEDGSGGTPAWVSRQATSRSGRRLRGPAAAVAAAAAEAGPGSAPPLSSLQQAQQGGVGRVASAPDLRAAQQQAVAAQQQQAMMQQQAMQQQQQQQQQPGGPGFVALPGGGLQLQFGAPPPPSAVDLFGPATGDAAPAALPLPGGAGGGQPLLVRVGSETHLIPHQAGGARGGGGAGAAAGFGGSAAPSALGKRMTRIQSEPSFARLEAAPAGGAGGVPELGDLMNDRDLFRAFDLPGQGGGLGGGALAPDRGLAGPPGGPVPAAEAAGAGGGGGGGGGDALLVPCASLDLDTSELLDFIKVGAGSTGALQSARARLLSRALRLHAAASSQQPCSPSVRLPNLPSCPPPPPQDMPDTGMLGGGGGGGRGGMFKSRSMGNLGDLSGELQQAGGGRRCANRLEDGRGASMLAAWGPAGCVQWRYPCAVPLLITPAHHPCSFSSFFCPCPQTPSSTRTMRRWRPWSLPAPARCPSP